MVAGDHQPLTLCVPTLQDGLIAGDTGDPIVKLFEVLSEDHKHAFKETRFERLERCRSLVFRVAKFLIRLRRIWYEICVISNAVFVDGERKPAVLTVDEMTVLREDPSKFWRDVVGGDVLPEDLGKIRSLGYDSIGDVAACSFFRDEALCRILRAK